MNSTAWRSSAESVADTSGRGTEEAWFQVLNKSSQLISTHWYWYPPPGAEPPP